MIKEVVEKKKKRKTTNHRFRTIFSPEGPGGKKAWDPAASMNTVNTVGAQPQSLQARGPFPSVLESLDQMRLSLQVLSPADEFLPSFLG